jgi:hypothetical protein
MYFGEVRYLASQVRCLGLRTLKFYQKQRETQTAQEKTPHALLSAFRDDAIIVPGNETGSCPVHRRGIGPVSISAKHAAYSAAAEAVAKTE